MTLLGFGNGRPLPTKERTLSSSDRRDFTATGSNTTTNNNNKHVATSGNKPLPLKQRTSSSSNQRDYNQKTWLSLLVLLKFREFFITVDHFSIWRRHLAWANDDGKELRMYMTQRFASNMVFMSLLLSTELGVLFNSAHVTTEVRNNLVNSQHGTISFWAGLLIIISALFTILSLISTFTAWAMVSSIDDNNAHCVLRSSIGQYAAELPGRFIVFSIYTFLISFMLFFFLLLPVGFWSILLLVCTSGLFFHVVSVFSGFGRIIMHSGAMSKQRIFSPEYEDFLVPESLHSNLLKKAKCNLAHNTSIIRQYRRKQQPINRSLEEEQLWDHLNGKADPNNQFANGGFENPDAAIVNRSRADSTVRFADEEQGVRRNDGAATVIIRGTKEGGGIGGGKLKQSSYSGQHQRSMTPLSALSEGSHRSNFSEITFDQDTPRSNIIQKHSSARPPPAPPRDESSIRNVSTASLEQWLQGSSPEKPFAKDDTNTTRPRSCDEGNAKSEATRSTLPLGTDETRPLLAFDSPPQEVVTNHIDPAITDDAINPNGSEDSVFSTSSGARSDRGLSEEERFAMDYGDFDSDDDNLNRTNEGEYNYWTHSQTFNPEIPKDVDDERSSLLATSTQNKTKFYSGLSPHAQTPPLSRGTLKRSNSKQDSSLHLP